MQQFWKRKLLFFKSILLLFLDCNSNSVLVYVHELWTKGEFLHFISLLDVLFQQYILQLPEQNGSAWVSHIASQLEKYNDVLRKADQIWKAFLVALSVKHNSLLIEEGTIFLFASFSFHKWAISPKKNTWALKLFSAYLLQDTYSKFYCMTLCLRNLETEQHWENKNSSGCRIRGSSSQVASLEQRPGPLQWWESMKKTTDCKGSCSFNCFKQEGNYKKTECAFNCISWKPFHGIAIISGYKFGLFLYVIFLK